MQNFVRSVKSHVWQTRTFRKMSVTEKLTYLYLLTSGATSDTSVYVLPLDYASLEVGVSVEEMEEIIRRFEKLGLVVYDWEQEEICVLDYFIYGTTPSGGLNYEMYAKDLDKIQNKALIEIAANAARKTDITIAFFAALQEFLPSLDQDEYRIRKTDKTVDDIKSAAKRGRTKIKKKQAERSYSSNDTSEDSSEDVPKDDVLDELPF